MNIPEQAAFPDGIPQSVSNPFPLPAAQFAPSKPVRVLYVCTHNSARSQMAEALTRALSGGQVEVYSAGTEPSGVHPDAIQTMTDMNIDMSRQYSKGTSEFLAQSFDYVITVCDNARESCPIFPNARVKIHWGFPDPAAVQDPAARAGEFKKTALGLSARIQELFALIQSEP
jgi:protein-tyrosine-phosphatase